MWSKNRDFYMKNTKLVIITKIRLANVVCVWGGGWGGSLCGVCVCVCPKLLNNNVNSVAVKAVKVATKQHCASRDSKGDDPLMNNCEH